MSNQNVIDSDTTYCSEIENALNSQTQKLRKSIRIKNKNTGQQLVKRKRRYRKKKVCRKALVKNDNIKVLSKNDKMIQQNLLKWCDLIYNHISGKRSLKLIEAENIVLKLKCLQAECNLQSELKEVWEKLMNQFTSILYKNSSSQDSNVSTLIKKTDDSIFNIEDSTALPFSKQDMIGCSNKQCSTETIDEISNTINLTNYRQKKAAGKKNINSTNIIADVELDVRQTLSNDMPMNFDKTASTQIQNENISVFSQSFVNTIGDSDMIELSIGENQTIKQMEVSQEKDSVKIIPYMNDNSIKAKNPSIVSLQPGAQKQESLSLNIFEDQFETNKNDQFQNIQDDKINKKIDFVNKNTKGSQVIHVNNNCKENSSNIITKRRSISSNKNLQQSNKKKIMDSKIDDNLQLIQLQEFHMSLPIKESTQNQTVKQPCITITLNSQYSWIKNIKEVRKIHPSEYLSKDKFNHTNSYFPSSEDFEDW